MPFLPEEEWRDIPGYEGLYQVSDRGCVRRVKSNYWYKAGTLLTTRHDKCGYMTVVLRQNEVQKTCYIHRLMMFAFVGVREKDIEVNHMNGVKDDNRLENLEYCTHEENIKHAAYVLCSPFGNKGEKHHMVKLTEENVREIRRLAQEGWLRRQIADKYGVTQECVTMIVNRKRWKHIE